MPAFSEKYRDDLRKREETIRSLRDAVSLHEIETGKWAKEHESYEERIAQLEIELSSAMEAFTRLDEQKQENLLLKETIDRMRFDMDEMRHAMVPGASGNSGHSSVANTMSKSLGAELMGQMHWEMSSHTEVDTDDQVSEGPTVIEEEEAEVDEDEDVIQTIITKRKRVGFSRFLALFHFIMDKLYRKWQVAQTSWSLLGILLRKSRNTRTVRPSTTPPYSLSTMACRPNRSAKLSQPHLAPKPTPSPSLRRSPLPLRASLSRWRFRQRM